MKPEYKKSVMEMSCSPQIKEMLLDPRVCKDIAKANESLQKILTQNQRDMVREDNMTTIGPAVFAHGQIVKILDLFAAGGEQVIAEEARVEKLKQNQS